MVVREDRANRDRGGVITTEAIYVDVNGDRVGSETDSRVHAQAYAAGAMVPKEDAARYGLARKSDHPADSRERKESGQSFVDAADHRKAVEEIGRLGRKVQEVEADNDDLRDTLAKREEEIAMLKDQAGAVPRKGGGEPETKIATGATETKPATTDEANGAKKPKATPATTEAKETK